MATKASKIRELFRKGHSVERIKIVVGCSLSTIYAVLSSPAMGWDPVKEKGRNSTYGRGAGRPVMDTPEVPPLAPSMNVSDKIRALYRLGYSTAEIGYALNKSQSHVGKTLRRNSSRLGWNWEVERAKHNK